MEDLGYRVLTAQNGPEALPIKRAVSPFTDLVMPARYQRERSWRWAIWQNVAGRRPRERVAKLHAVPAEEYQTERGRCPSQEKPSATSRRS